MGGNELPSEEVTVAESGTAEAGSSRRGERSKAALSRKEKGKGGQQTRVRQTLVCGECKHAKQKCDLEEPCGRCTMKGFPDKCIYPEGPQNKPEEPSLEARVGNLEKFVGQLVEGVVPVLWAGGAPSSNEEVERSKAEHIAAGRTLRPNPSIFLSTRAPSPQNRDPASELGATMTTNGTSALLSCVSDAAHGCLHLICQSEGLQDDIPYNCNCCHCRTTGPARGILIPRSQVLDSVRFLPAPKTYYRSVPGATSFSGYPKQQKVHQAYVNAKTPPPVFPSSLSTSPPSRPFVTQELMRLIPAMPKALDYLTRAQAILTDAPVDIGQWSHAAAWPEGLRYMVGNEISKPSGWPRVRNRVKQLWGKEKQPRPSTRPRIAPSQAVPPPISPPTPAASMTAAEREEAQGLQSTSATSVNETLPFFALACSLFAVGADPAKDTSPENPESAPYLLALSQQALSVWIDGGEHLPTRSTEIPDELVKEARADYLRAQSVAIQYYLGKVGRSAIGAKFIAFGHPNKRQLLNLASKMAVRLAAWGYEEGLVLVEGNCPVTVSNDTTSRPGLIRSVVALEAEQARLRLFWQVVHYERYIASMFRREALIPDSKCLKTRLPTLVPDYRDLAASFLESAAPRGPEPQSNRLAQPSRSSGNAPVDTAEREAEEERLQVERKFFALRARITHLAITVERQTCAGYTLGEAAKLTTEVRMLLAMAPAEFRWACERAVECTSSAMLADRVTAKQSFAPGSMATTALSEKALGKQRADEAEHLVDTSHQAEPTNSDLRIRSFSRELSLMAQLLIVRIYSPFAPKLNAAELPTLSPCPGALLDASMAIIRIATLFRQPGETICSLRVASSTLLNMYPLDQLVFDAVVLCSQHCLDGTTAILEEDMFEMKAKDLGGTEIMQTIGMGLDMLEARYGVLNDAGQTSGTSEGNAHSTSPSVKARIIAFLRKQWSHRKASFERPKRRRGSTEGDAASSSTEPETARVSHVAGGVNFTKKKKGLLPSTTMDQRSGDASPSDATVTPAEVPSKEIDPSVSTSAKPIVPRVTRQELSDKNRAKHTSSGSRGEIAVKIGARALSENLRGSVNKQKAASKLRTSTRATRTAAPRAALPDGAEYGNADRALYPAQRQTHFPQDVTAPQQAYALSAASATTQLRPPPLAYGIHGAGPSLGASAGHVAQDDYTSDRAIVPPSLVPTIISGYAIYGPPATAYTSPHHQRPEPAYAPRPPPPTPVPATSYQGYSQSQAIDNASNTDGRGYGSSSEAEVYQDKQLQSYTRQSIPPPDLPTTSQSSLANWHGYISSIPDDTTVNTSLHTWMDNSGVDNQWSSLATDGPSQ